MPLPVGTRLGPSEILAPIGAGGMGEVYRARDTEQKRDVALKVLPETFARDPERMARFRRGAEVLASLSVLHLVHEPDPASYQDTVPLFGLKRGPVAAGSAQARRHRRGIIWRTCGVDREGRDQGRRLPRRTA